MENFYLIDSKEGGPSLVYHTNGQKFYLHSIYNPQREAKTFVTARQKEIEAAKLIIIYGLGLGYHLCEIAKLIGPGQEVYVLETNQKILKYSRAVVNFTKFEEIGFNFLLTDNCQEISHSIYSLLGQYHYSDISFIVHRPSLKIMPGECSFLKELIEDWEIKRDSIQRFSRLMLDNFQSNLKLREKFNFLEISQKHQENFPVVMIASGPSLDRNKHLLEKFKGKALTIAVGSALKSLLLAGFIPDCIVITDPQPGVSRQIEGLERKIPLLCLLTISPEIISNYNGPIFAILQNGFGPAEELADKLGLPLVDTGGSVITTALDIVLRLGGNPVIFTGLDLAYTKGRVHARGTSHEDDLPNSRSRLVKDIRGGLVKTGKNLCIYKRWIEGKIRENPSLNFIDATEGGAFVAGTRVKKLRDVINQLEERKDLLNKVRGINQDK
ncbi:MAG: 6-hydroxymethylpterin diphosphokinase MptE-like protein [Halanaerobium sp.]|nr:6-hydroxymethylpterin diphosphokinase MptE-like protein [Halanaerobium sp.]